MSQCIQAVCACLIMHVTCMLVVASCRYMRTCMRCSTTKISTQDIHSQPTVKQDQEHLCTFNQKSDAPSIGFSAQVPYPAPYMPNHIGVHRVTINSGIVHAGKCRNRNCCHCTWRAPSSLVASRMRLSARSCGTQKCCRLAQLCPPTLPAHRSRVYVHVCAYSAWVCPLAATIGQCNHQPKIRCCHSPSHQSFPDVGRVPAAAVMAGPMCLPLIAPLLPEVRSERRRCSLLVE